MVRLGFRASLDRWCRAGQGGGSGIDQSCDGAQFNARRSGGRRRGYGIRVRAKPGNGRIYRPC